MAKMPGSNTHSTPPAPKPPTSGTPRPPSAKKDTFYLGVKSASYRSSGGRKKEVTDEEVMADPRDPNKKLHVSAILEAK
jgi:hypothetical protein